MMILLMTHFVEIMMMYTNMTIDDLWVWLCVTEAWSIIIPSVSLLVLNVCVLVNVSG